MTCWPCRARANPSIWREWEYWKIYFRRIMYCTRPSSLPSNEPSLHSTQDNHLAYSLLSLLRMCRMNDLFLYSCKSSKARWTATLAATILRDCYPPTYVMYFVCLRKMVRWNRRGGGVLLHSPMFMSMSSLGIRSKEINGRSKYLYGLKG